MYLKRLNLTNFKNYPQARLEFSPGLNCLVGDNGVGKTNLLDAMYYLSFCKSYFNLQDMQNIRAGEDFFAIHGFYGRENDQEVVVDCLQKRNQKKLFRYNKKEYDRLADHIGLLPLVMVSPSDADLINLGSEERRKYIDGVISQFDPVYLDQLLVYNKVLLQRNALLKTLADPRQAAPALGIWDHQMLAPAATIHEKRAAFLEAFIPLFQRYFSAISMDREKVGIAYESQLSNQALQLLLRDSLQRDLALKYTTAGVHKDDLLFTINGFPVKKFGSQGQQKSFLVAMKLAQFEYTRQIKGFKPLLLLDDVFDKLDERRVMQIINLAGNDSFGQVMITDTHPGRIRSLLAGIHVAYSIFNIQPDQQILAG